MSNDAFDVSCNGLKATTNLWMFNWITWEIDNFLLQDWKLAKQSNTRIVFASNNTVWIVAKFSHQCFFPLI